MIYWLHAVDSHSLHAPFIYSLFTEVIQPQHALKLQSLEHFRKELYRETDTILVNDLGAGAGAGAGQDQKPGKRVIGQIAKNSHNPKVAELLYRLVQHFDCRKVLELGTNLGLTTMNLAEAAPQGTIATIEGCPNLAARAQRHFKKLGLQNIQLIVGAIEEKLVTAIADLGPPDLVYIDANHRFEPTLSYFETCIKEIHEKSVMVLDDIHWSREMSRAWGQIKDDPRVRISVDLYRVGLLFFDTKFAKKHYILEF